MDLDAIKVLLEAQERTFRTAMDIVVEQLKSRIQTMEGTIADLIKSLEFTQAEVLDYKGEIKSLRKSDNEKKIIIEGLKTRIDELERRLNYQEDYNRRNNLRITGIQEQPGETWEQTSAAVMKLLEEKLQLPPMNLERAHRVGPVDPSRPRTVVVRFNNFGDREAVMRNARKLKGTRVYINEDLCSASQEIKKNQIHLLRQARQEGKIAFFKYTKLIIKEKSGQQSLSVGGAGCSASDGGGNSTELDNSFGGSTTVKSAPVPDSGTSSGITWSTESEGAAAAGTVDVASDGVDSATALPVDSAHTIPVDSNGATDAMAPGGAGGKVSSETAGDLAEAGGTKQRQQRNARERKRK